MRSHGKATEHNQGNLLTCYIHQVIEGQSTEDRIAEEERDREEMQSFRESARGRLRNLFTGPNMHPKS